VAPDPENLIWIDLEMTGLDPDTDRILEIATLVTDKYLRILATGPELAIRQPEAVLEGMDEWNTEHHSRSGLWERVLSSGVSEAEAEQATLAFIRQYVAAVASPMCCNTRCQDRLFLVRHMPALEAYFHYRQIDVSTLKELARRWAPAVLEGEKKESAHRALADIEESVAELRHYRARLFRGEFGGE